MCFLRPPVAFVLIIPLSSHFSCVYVFVRLHVFVPALALIFPTCSHFMLVCVCTNAVSCCSQSLSFSVCIPLCSCCRHFFFFFFYIWTNFQLFIQIKVQFLTVSARSCNTKSEFSTQNLPVEKTNPGILPH